MKSRGLSLVEIILVLAVIAILITLSIRQFQVYRRRAAITAVKADLRSLKQAITQYYYTTGCKPDGEFASNNLNPSLATLDLTHLTNGRRPIAITYAAAIVKLNQTTKENQPIYQLKIQLTLNSDFSPVKRLWYKKALAANSQNDSALTWTFLPHLAATGLRTDAAQDLALFKQQQNKNLGIAQSNSYCAH